MVIFLRKRPLPTPTPATRYRILRSYRGRGGGRVWKCWIWDHVLPEWPQRGRVEWTGISHCITIRRGTYHGNDSKIKCYFADETLSAEIRKIRRKYFRNICFFLWIWFPKIHLPINCPLQRCKVTAAMGIYRRTLRTWANRLSKSTLLYNNLFGPIFKIL